MIVLAVFAILGIAAFALEGRLSLLGLKNDRFQEEEDEEPDEGTITLGDEEYLINDRYETFLFMGTDASGNENAIGKDYVGSLADFLLLMVINHTDKTYAFLPLDRNTMADVSAIDKDGTGEELYFEQQLCTAHWYGGNKEMSCKNTVLAVSNYLGELNIDGYYAISMTEIPRINHGIGGVTVTLTDDFSKKDPAMKKGATLNLTDRQAEIYVRSRMEMSDDTNKNRMNRQMTYMKAAMKKVEGKLKEDPDYINEASEEFADVATSGINGRQKSHIANAMAEYDYKGMYNIEGKVTLGDTFDDGEEHEEFRSDPDSLLSVMTELYKLEKNKDD